MTTFQSKPLDPKHKKSCFSGGIKKSLGVIKIDELNPSYLFQMYSCLVAQILNQSHGALQSALFRSETWTMSPVLSFRTT